MLHLTRGSENMYINPKYEVGNLGQNLFMTLSQSGENKISVQHEREV